MMPRFGLAVRAGNLLPGDAARPAIVSSALLGRLVTTDRLVLVLLFVFWAICNPYYEIDRSSLIYAARAFADLDPTGVGRDLMFVHDGQSGFTIFTPIYRLLAERLGLASASLLLAAASVVASFVGAVVLAQSITKGRTRLLAIAFAAALPACYGGYKVFSYAETAATPRPFTEAIVLLGLAALVRGRFGLAALAMAVATGLHPIMAFPGLLAMAIWLVLVDRRFFVVVVAAAIAPISLAAAHVAPFDRLLVPLDPAWKAVLLDRSAVLFPSLWPATWMGRLAVRVSTLIIAASLTTGPVRKLFIVTLLVGVLGFATAYVFGERMPLVLVAQAQIWRTLWLVFSMATFAAAICVVELWSKGGNGRIVLALLVLSWVFRDYDRAMILTGATLAFHFCLRRTQDVLPRWATTIVIAVAAVLVGAGLIWTEVAITRSIGQVAAERAADARRTLAIDWEYTPLAVLAAVLVLGRFVPARRMALSALLACGCILLVATWDRRSTENRYFDSDARAPDLQALIDTRPGEVFWLDGRRESWTWLHRPQWISAIQGAGLVFSRPLALVYRDRANLAIKAGLADDSILAPFADNPHEAVFTLDPEKIAAFCAAPAAPAWIVVPAVGDRPAPAMLHAVRWAAPIDKLTPSDDADGALSWRTVSAYDVVPCAR